MEQLPPNEPVDAVLCGSENESPHETLENVGSAKRAAFNGSLEQFRALAVEGLVDELRIEWRPRIVGGKSAPAIPGPSFEFLPKSIRLDLQKMERRGSECVARYRVRTI